MNMYDGNDACAGEREEKQTEEADKET